jgi:hypothetical protein
VVSGRSGFPGNEPLHSNRRASGPQAPRPGNGVAAGFHSRNPIWPFSVVPMADVPREDALSELPQNSPAAVRCHGCVHFQVTYQADWPYACRAYGLRSRRLPSAEVLHVSGHACQLREARPRAG